MQLNINTSETVKYTNKLEKLHRSALPNAIRGALNKAAFDVKQNTMPRSAQKNFVNRQPNFFKANSRVDMAKGWAIKDMKATVGFTENGLKGGNNYAVKDLEQQERGGTIKGKSFIPTGVARGGSNARPVRPGHRLANIRNVVNSNRGSGSRRKRFIQAVLQARQGGHVIGNRGNKILWRIDGISRTRGHMRIRMKPLYSFEENRSVRVAATGFMREASMESGNKIATYYAAEAKRQIERLR